MVVYLYIRTTNKTVMRKRKTISCVDTATAYNQIKNAKHNRKALPNGDIRIGNDMALSKKTNLIYIL